MKDLTLARDRISQLYMGEIFSKEVQEIAKERIDWISGQAEGAVLDVGCSEGILELLMAREGLNVTGVDINGSAIEYAKKLILNERTEIQERIKFIESSIYDLDCEEGSFDTLILTEVLEHMANPERLLGHCLKFLKPKGKVILTVPFSYHPDPDHRQIFTIEGFIDTVKDFFTPSIIDIKGKYIRCIGRKDIFDEKFNYKELLHLSEANFLEIHKKYYGINSDNTQKIKNLYKEIALERKLINTVESLKERDKILVDSLKQSEMDLKNINLQVKDYFNTSDEKLDNLSNNIEQVSNRQVNDRSEINEILEDLKIKTNQLKDYFNTSDEKLNNLSNNIEQVSNQQLNDRSEINEFIKDLMNGKSQQMDVLSRSDNNLKFISTNLDELISNQLRVEKKLDFSIGEVQYENIKLRKLFDENKSKQKYITEAVIKIYRKQFADEKKIDSRLNEIYNWITYSKKEQGLIRKNKIKKIKTIKRNKNLKTNITQKKLTSAIRKLFSLIKVGIVKGFRHPFKFFKFSTLLLINILLHPIRAKQTIYGMYQYICLGRTDIRVPGNKKVYEAYIKERDEELINEKFKYKMVKEERSSNQLPSLSKSITKIRKSVQELKIGAIMDVFTRACFEPECNIITFRPDNWKKKLEQNCIDFLLVESAWAGNSGSWQYRIASYSAPPDSELDNLLKWCNEKQIPTIFWNKEDPPNFNRFIESATKFNYIFTTDVNCVRKYMKICGHDRVFVLPFAAQPKIHNPMNTAEREKDVCFAGTYYADCFEKRQEAMDALLDGASSFSFDIFDRQHGYAGSDRSRFLYPERFQKFIRGRLEYNEMVNAYRNYQVFLNVNSVNDSPTMFSRRVFELLACGTPVISTPCKGIDNYFDRIVPQADSKENTKDYIKKLIENKEWWKKVSALGLRNVMKEHTYSHRLKQITNDIGFSVKQDSKKLILVVILSDNSSALIESISKQSKLADKVFVMENGLAKNISKGFIKAGIKSQIINKNQLWEIISKDLQEDFIAFIDTKDSYGPNYLLDASLALSYGQLQISGMSSCFTYAGNNSVIFNDTLGLENSKSSNFYKGSLIMLGKVIDENLLSGFLTKEIVNISSGGYSRYSFEYINKASNKLIPKEIENEVYINEGSL